MKDSYRIRFKELGIDKIENIALPVDSALNVGSHSLASWMANKFNYNMLEEQDIIIFWMDNIQSAAA